MRYRYLGKRDLKKFVVWCGVVILALGASNADAARAKVTNLRSGALHNRDLPAGFVVARVMLYTHFNNVITASAVVRGASAARQSVVCDAPAGVTQKGFKQGMLEGVFNTRLSGRVVLCGWRFHTKARAHLAFDLALSKAGWWDQLKKGVYRQLRTGALGDEAFGIRAKAPSVRPGSPTRNYLLYFRHANAFFSMEYLGSRALTPARFVRMALVTDSRLR